MDKEIANKMDNETKKTKNHTTLKIVLGAAAFSSILYFGNAFNVKNHINQGFLDARNAIVDLCTTDVGELSTKLYNKLEKTDDINLYKDEIQQMMYSINDRFIPKNQFNTIDGLIERVDPDVQQKIIDNTYNRQDSDFKAKFTNQHFNDIPYERRIEIGKEIVNNLYEKNKGDVRKNMDELWENFNKFYKELINKFKE